MCRSWLRHCRTNGAQDVEGYKGLIARPYESVNRAMPGSYYSDAERTIYLTYYLLMEDISKYDELFQQQREFISYEFFAEHVGHLEYDDLVYGTHKLSELVAKVPQTKEGLTRFLYEIILRLRRTTPCCPRSSTSSSLVIHLLSQHCGSWPSS